MAGEKVYGGSDMTILLQDERRPCGSEVFESLWIPSSSPTFHGSKSIVSFENVGGGDCTERSFFQRLDQEENGDDDYDGCFHQPGKKRRLTVDQVQFLERNFELENKLEPERKVQLAKELGLQPRQVAIWFQNRRARYKTKQLEREYDSLKASFDKLKADYDNLQKGNEILMSEVNSLKNKLVTKEKVKQNLGSQNTTNSPPHSEPQNPSQNAASDNVSNVPMVVCKQEDASSGSAKSDVFDSDSPHYTENHSSLLEPAGSSHVFEPDQSDFSQDEDDNLSKSFLPTLCFPKLETSCYDDPPASSCNFGFSLEDQPFYFWP